MKRIAIIILIGLFLTQGAVSIFAVPPAGNDPVSPAGNDPASPSGNDPDPTPPPGNDPDPTPPPGNDPDPTPPPGNDPVPPPGNDPDPIDPDPVYPDPGPGEPFVPAPTVDIKANNSDGPIDIAYNTAATLTWTSTNADSCVASAGWSGNKAVSGSESTGNLTSTKTYTIACAGAGGTATDSVIVNVCAACEIEPPIVDIKANNSDGPIDIAYNTAATLTWTSTNADSCVASAGWSGNKAVSGSESTGNLTSTKTYTITCAGEGGSASDSVTVNVGAKPADPVIPAPTVDIKANNSDGPIDIAYNTAATLTWTSANAESCAASEDWSGAKGLSGSQSTGNLTSAKTYAITCIGSGDSASDSVTVNVGSRPYSRGSSSAVSSYRSPIVYIKKTVRNVSQGTVFSDLVYANPGENLIFGIVVKAGNNSLNQVIVKDILPEGLIYQGGLMLDDALIGGDISAGLNIGDFSADQSKTITFQVNVAEAAMFSFGENKIINTALASQDSVSAEDTAEIIVLKGEVAGAATEISTGLTNNIFLDSFFLPLVLTCFVIWLIKSHIVKFEEWLDLRKKQYRVYKSRKTLQLKIAKIKTKEFFGRMI